jgi:hypothetical protein
MGLGNRREIADKMIIFEELGFFPPWTLELLGAHHED